MAKLLEIFRVGKHTASDGKTYEFTEGMLRAAVEAYDPAAFEAPIVVGHPKTNDPAYGWIRSLSFQDGLIQATPADVDPQFAELVAAKRYKNISASWYLPDSPGNPRPGTLYLRHVGFLGAQPPAIKGLKAASFAATEVGVVEFADWQTTTIASMFRRLREWVISDRGLEAADNVLPDWQIKSLEEAPPSAMPAYSEPPPKEKSSMATAEELARRERELNEREAGIRTRERASSGAANAAFAESLMRAGQLLPAQRVGLVAFMDSLTDAGTIEFSEGGKTIKAASLDWLKGYLQAQPKLVKFGEHANGSGEPVDCDDANALAAAAVKFQESEREAGRTVSVAAAITHIKKQQGDN